MQPPAGEGAGVLQPVSGGEGSGGEAEGRVAGAPTAPSPPGKSRGPQSEPSARFPQITQLKIASNPFAKGFRDCDPEDW